MGPINLFVLLPWDFFLSYKPLKKDLVGSKLSLVDSAAILHVFPCKTLSTIGNIQWSLGFNDKIKWQSCSVNFSDASK